ncbi:hypothetical protein BHE74_00036653, partial [Ensete ventricosum]
MSYRVFGILRQSVDQGLNLFYPRFSFFLRALYPKESSLPLVELLQGRFKNIEAGFHRCKSLFVAPFPSWRTRLRLLRSRRIPNFTLVLFAVALLMSGSNSLQASLHLQPTYGCLGQGFAISTYTGRYIPIRQVIGTRTVRYQAVPPKIDRRRSIEEETNRQRSIKEEKGKKKRKRRKKEEKKEYLARAPSSPVDRPRPRSLFLPRGEKDRGD